MIFKGGVTWPAACFQLLITNSGTTASPMYWGVDLTYFTGSSFTRPIFDMANTLVSGSSGFGTGSVIYSATAGNITFDNLEIKRQRITVATHANCNFSAINFTNDAAAGNITVKNSYLHGWTPSATPTFNTLSYADGSLCQVGSTGTFVADNVEINDADGTIVRFGGGIKNFDEVKNSKIHDVMAGCFTVHSCHDSEFYNITTDVQSFDSNIHTQVIENDIPSGSASGGDLVYNNLIHNNAPVGVTIYVPYNSFIYNNVMWSNGRADILLTFPSGDSSAKVGYVENNTIDCSNTTPCVASDNKTAMLGTLNLKNNHFITNGTPTCFNSPGVCVNIATISTIGSGGTNITMSTAAATTQGYVIANKYQPTASANSTVSAGTNLTGSCSGSLASLCTTSSAGNTVSTKLRRTSGNWDIGGYQFGGTGATPPSAPTSLNGTVSAGTVSLSWTASSGTPIPTAYTTYRGTVHGGPYVSVASGLTSTASTDTPASGTYFYVVTAYVGAFVSSVTGNGTTATVTCTASCAFPSGTSITIAGNSSFNGTFTSTSQPTSSTFTFASSISATVSGGGVWKVGNESPQSNEITVNTAAVKTATLLPSSRTFASQTVGTSSATQSVTFTNTSAAGNTVTISAKGITSGTNPGDFSQTNNCPSLVLSGTNCTFNVTFLPTAPGTRTANLTVTDDATGSPQTTTLSGTGVAAAPLVNLNPTSLNFGDQTLSTTSTVRSIILTNTGTGTLTVSSVVASGDFAVVTVPVTNCGGTVAPLATCSLNITFTPTATGGRVGAVTVTDNATGSPHVASLAGNGINTKCQMTGNVTLSGVASICQ